jgi:uncharacterized protein with HEPN domain
MPPDPDDYSRAYLWDMREAARDILAFMDGVSFSQFAGNKMLRFAVERQLLVLGEAANHLTDEFRDEHPEIPWRQIIGLRHILAHEYGEILAERIWQVAVDHVPTLSAHLDALLPHDPDSTESADQPHDSE